jgi:PhnB protein
MHVGLPISEETMLLGCDTMQEMTEFPFVAGTNFSITVSVESEEEARRIFEALSAEGTITMPLEKTFWAALFGMFTDRFGINWMIDYELKQ